MMIRKDVISKVFMLAFLFFNFPAIAAEVNAKSAQNIDELMTKSGLQRQIEQLPEVVNASFEQRLSQESAVKPEEAARIKDILSQSYNPSAMLGSIKADITAGLTDQDIEPILSWLNSPLGQKITQLEEKASSGDAYRNMQAFAAGLESNPAEPTRLDMIERLDQAAHITEFSVRMKIDMVLIMTESMSSAAGRNDFSREQLLSQLEMNRPKIEEASKQEAMISGLYTYQSLTDDELKDYINFYTSQAGVKYANVVTQGLLTALQNGSKDMGEKLGNLLKPADAKK
jgi:hypothetical protein